MKRIHPKILRLRNGVGRTYDRYDTTQQECLKAFNCPACGKRIAKGDVIFQGHYLTEKDQWNIRLKKFCSQDCVPPILKSK